MLNRGEDLERVRIEDALPVGARVTRGSTVLICGLKKRASATIRYEMVLEEPQEARFQDCTVFVKSMFGLTATRLQLPAPSPVTVYPRLFRRRIGMGRAKAFSWAGSAPSRFRGGRLDFMNIREYAGTDPVRDVNWKATAREGKMLVNEWHAERGLDCIVVVDLSTENLPRVGTWTARTEVVSCSYELAHALIHSGNRVGMLVLGSTLSKIRPGFGTNHLRVMLDALVRSQEGWVWKLEHADDFLETFFRAQYRQRGGTLFLVSAVGGTPLLGTVARLSRKGFAMNCVLVDTLDRQVEELRKKGLGQGPEMTQATRLAAAEREWFVNEFKSFSKVYAWNRQRGFAELEGARV